MKRIIVCFDGTWNTADNRGSPTNVVRLARMIPTRDAAGVSQIVHYDQGVGTGNAVDKLAGGALGRGLENIVKSGYRFLSQNYEKGDEVFLYGFSRGAFTARSLGGFIGACRGLLFRDKAHKIEAAWRYYRTKPSERNQFELHNEIEQYVERDIKIKVLGVFDTVGSLGIPTDIFNTWNRAAYAFHDTTLSKLVINAFQALAIDEKRGPFAPTLWMEPKTPIAGQTTEQVWFPGVHSDIGGGYDSSELSDLTLRWMMGRSRAFSGIAFDADKLAYFLPETVYTDVADAARRDEQFERLRSKAGGTLHDSLGYYAASRLMPRLRTIGAQKPRLGTGPLKKLFRVSASSGYREAIHWSAKVRQELGKARDIDAYNPPNLRVALDNLPQVNMEDETKATSF